MPCWRNLLEIHSLKFTKGKLITAGVSLEALWNDPRWLLGQPLAAKCSWPQHWGAGCGRSHGSICSASTLLPRKLNPFPFAVFIQHPLMTKLSIIPPADKGKPLKRPSPLLYAMKGEFGPMRHNMITGILYAQSFISAQKALLLWSSSNVAFPLGPFSPSSHPFANKIKQFFGILSILL